MDTGVCLTSLSPFSSPALFFISARVSALFFGDVRAQRVSHSVQSLILKRKMMQAKASK